MRYCEYCHGVVKTNKYRTNACDNCGADTLEILGYFRGNPVYSKKEYEELVREIEFMPIQDIKLL